MEKATVKIELDRDDISTLMKLCGRKLTDEQWLKIKSKECIINDEDMGDQAIQIKLVMSAFVISTCLKEE